MVRVLFFRVATCFFLFLIVLGGGETIYPPRSGHKRDLLCVGFCLFFVIVCWR